MMPKILTLSLFSHVILKIRQKSLSGMWLRLQVEPSVYRSEMAFDQLTLATKVKLLSGYDMPILGLGVFENDDCRPACLAALECGYRWAAHFLAQCRYRWLLFRHIDTAEYYKNEVEVGQAVRESGIPRKDIFISRSESQRVCVYCQRLMLFLS